VGGFPGLQTLPIPSIIKRRIAKTFFLYGMGADSGTGSVTCEDGHLRVTYDPGKEPIYDEVRAAFRVLSSESGDKLWAVGKPLTVHAGGGACVGPDAERGVVDHRGEIYGNPGLFVADGAALPTAVGGPPSLAITAWAHYVGDAIAGAA
jgi:cholesterol oxidase